MMDTSTAEQIARECVNELGDKAVNRDGWWPTDATPIVRNAITAALAPLQAELDERDLTITSYAEALKSFGWKPADQSLQEFLSSLISERDEARAALRLALPHHQGFHSEVGAAIKKALGITAAQAKEKAT